MKLPSLDGLPVELESGTRSNESVRGLSHLGASRRSGLLSALGVAVLAFFVGDRLGVVGPRGALLEVGLLACGGVAVLALLLKGVLRTQVCVTALLSLVIALPINRLANLTRVNLVTFLVVTTLLGIVGCVARRPLSTVLGNVLVGVFAGAMLVATVLAASQSGLIKLALPLIPAIAAFSLAARLEFVARRQVSIALVVLACAEAGLAVAEPFTFPNHLYSTDDPIAGDLTPVLTDSTLLVGLDRSNATFGHALPLGFFLMVALALLLRVVQPSALIKWCFVILVGLAVVFAGSRNSLLIGALLLLLFPPVRLTSVRLIWAGLVVSISLLLAVMTERIPVRFFEEFFGSGSYTHRVAVWDAFAQLLTKQSVISVGFGNGFGSLPSLFAQNLLQTDGFNVVDNQFVAALAQGGMLAMLILAALLLRPLASHDRYWRAAVLVLLVNCFVYDWFGWPSSAALGFFVLGCAYSQRSEPRSSKEGSAPRLPGASNVLTRGSAEGILLRDGVGSGDGGVVAGQEVRRPIERS